MKVGENSLQVKILRNKFTFCGLQEADRVLGGQAESEVEGVQDRHGEREQGPAVHRDHGEQKQGHVAGVQD